MANNENLHNAKVAKNDEFYTMLTDVEKEMRHYRQHFNGATVLCNCDDPFESAFFKYFVLNFNRLHLKKLISTCYAGSPVAGAQLSLFDLTGDESKRRKPYKAVVTSVHDTTGDGGIDMDDIKALFKSGENELTELEGDGDFRSPECLALMDEADIVCSNPPFSLLRSFVSTLIEHNKKFIIIGNKNMITYKEIFPLLKDNKMWFGANSPAPKEFMRPDGTIQKFGNIGWFTNLDLKKRHEDLILVKHYTPEAYPHYDNYDAIEVSKVADIPCDYPGVMGVPITIFDALNSSQFQVLGMDGKYWGEQLGIAPIGKKWCDLYFAQGGTGHMSPAMRSLVIIDGNGNARTVYKRILIRNRHPEAPKEV